MIDPSPSYIDSVISGSSTSDLLAGAPVFDQQLQGDLAGNAVLSQTLAPPTAPPVTINTQLQTLPISSPGILNLGTLTPQPVQTNVPAPVATIHAAIGPAPVASANCTLCTFLRSPAGIVAAVALTLALGWFAYRQGGN